MSSKVGHPAMVQDSDIDAQLPSRNGLSKEEMEDFYDPAHLAAQVTLARITGNVLSNIYHIPQPDRANTFVRGVQSTLTSLRNFHETLPSILRLDLNSSPMYPNRSVASLHLHFNQVCKSTTWFVHFAENLIVCHSHHTPNFILRLSTGVQPREKSQLKRLQTSISYDYSFG